MDAIEAALQNASLEGVIERAINGQLVPTTADAEAAADATADAEAAADAEADAEAVRVVRRANLGGGKKKSRKKVKKSRKKVKKSRKKVKKSRKKRRNKGKRKTLLKKHRKTRRIN